MQYSLLPNNLTETKAVVNRHLSKKLATKTQQNNIKLVKDQDLKALDEGDMDILFLTDWSWKRWRRSVTDSQPADRGQGDEIKEEKETGLY